MFPALLTEVMCLFRNVMGYLENTVKSTLANILAYVHLHNFISKHKFKCMHCMHVLFI